MAEVTNDWAVVRSAKKVSFIRDGLDHGMLPRIHDKYILLSM